MYKCRISPNDSLAYIHYLIIPTLRVNTFLLHTILHTLMKIGSCKYVKHRNEDDFKNVRLFNASLFDTNVN
jgi:hypothetical protein